MDVSCWNKGCAFHCVLLSRPMCWPDWAKVQTEQRRGGCSLCAVGHPKGAAHTQCGPEVRTRRLHVCSCFRAPKVAERATLGSACTRRSLDRSSLNILLASEIIAMNQDPLGVAGDLVWKQGPVEVCTRQFQQVLHAQTVQHAHRRTSKCRYARLCWLEGPAHRSLVHVDHRDDYRGLCISYSSMMAHPACQAHSNRAALNDSPAACTTSRGPGERGVQKLFVPQHLPLVHAYLGA